ncbi:MAG: GNAT family N-acetyltransferase [Chitinophagia bacterium]|jgi:predicted GNAT family N-acyltransferase
MALKFIDHGSPEYNAMIDLRMEILRKPLGLSFTEEELAREKGDILLGAFDDDKIVACCILTKVSSDTCKLRQMAVSQKMQRNGIGAALMHFAENVARDAGYRNMIMNARKTAQGFYEKLGYKADGSEFIEVTIPHYEMRKNIV